MKPKWQHIITGIFLVMGIVAFYFILKEHSLKEILDLYANFSWQLLLAYIAVIAGLFIILTWRWNVIIKSRGYRVPFINLYWYRIIGTSINYLTPGPRVGGEPAQANLLGKHRIKFNKALSTIMIDKIIDTTSCGLMFIMGVVLVMLNYSFPKDTVVVLISASILFIILVIIFYYRMLTNRHFFLHIFRILHIHKIKVRWVQKLEKSIEEIELIMIDFYNNNKKAFITTILLSVLTWVFMFAEYKLATTLLGLNIGATELFFIISFIGVAQLFPIPMAMGVLEAGQVSAFTMINLPTGAGVALAFLVRAKDIIVALIGLVLLSIFGFRAGKIVKKKYVDREATKHPDESFLKRKDKNNTER